MRRVGEIKIGGGGGGAAAVASLLLVLALDSAAATSAAAATSSTAPTPAAMAAFVGHGSLLGRQSALSRTLSARGGARRAAVVDEYDSDIDEAEADYEIEEEDDEEEEEEEEEIRVARLTKSAAKAAAKARTRKVTAAKRTVSAGLSQTKPKKRRASILKALHIPYIIRASLNPFTFFAMTKAYFASLFNIDYLQEDSSQTLRSALEDKAKKAAAAGGKKPKRTFKPGQAKTLSDLPQLSA